MLCVLEYTQVTGSEALPLGAYFQQHVQSLVQSNKRKLEEQFALLTNVVRQLELVCIISQ